MQAKILKVHDKKHSHILGQSFQVVDVIGQEYHLNTREAIGEDLKTNRFCLEVDEVAWMIQYEGAEMDDDEAINGFQHLINTGLVWSLQGHYGRTANSLIENGYCKKVVDIEEKPTENESNQIKNIHPYTWVTNDKTVEYEGGQKLRFIIYGAYNAMGLIGSECNGIAILNENARDIVADEIGKTSSFAYNSSNTAPKSLVEKFNQLTSMTYEQVKSFINESPRKRYSL